MTDCDDLTCVDPVDYAKHLLEMRKPHPLQAEIDAATVAALTSGTTCVTIHKGDDDETQDTTS